jgi:hypothetical protein
MSRVRSVLSSVALPAMLLTTLPLAWAAENLVLPLEADAGRIRADMTFLADDALEGREAGARGHEIAARYVAARFDALGLEPAGEDGWFQQVPLRAARLELGSPSMTVVGADGAERELDFPEEFSVGASTVREESAVEAELVFVGYGVVADAFEHDDYAGLDVAGKIVVMLAGAPLSWPSEERAHFSRSKAEAAVERGAVGIVSLATPVSERVFPFSRRALYLHLPRMGWIAEDGTTHRGYPELLANAQLSMEAAGSIFAGAARSAEELMAMVEEDRVPTGFELPGRLRLGYRSALEDLTSPNVVARLPGSDPALAEEHIVLTAHLDHIGFARTMTGDDVNNGAMDNASGVATLLEAARLLVAARPARSVLFTIVTAEEKGLLGADYFARNPTVPARSMIANVNLDMPMLTFPFADVVAFGASHSSLGDHVGAAALASDVMLSPDPFPEQAIFVRSDHYRFVQQGVPAVMLATGQQSLDPERPGKAAWETFLAEHYHKPSDEVGPDVDFDSAARFAALNARVVLSLSAADAPPVWLDGDFFGELYGGAVE